VVEHGAEAEGERLGQGAAVIGGGGPIAMMGYLLVAVGEVSEGLERETVLASG
jgi:hypothetical protein